MKCNFCDNESDDVVNYRQGTAYADEELNFVNACPQCRIENDEYWIEKWKEYYEGCL